MGCFDSVYFRCPRCQDRIEVQSKAAECDLHDYEPDAVPAKIAADIVGERVWCARCDVSWTVVSINSPPTVVMRLA